MKKSVKKKITSNLSSKGISPLIATVLIIGFTIVLAGMIIAWGGGLFKSVQESQGKSSEKALLSASVVTKLIVSAERVDDGLVISIDNRNDNPVEAVNIRVKDSSGNVVGAYKSTVGIRGFSVRKYGIGKSSLGGVYDSAVSVEVIPALKDSTGKQFVAQSSAGSSVGAGSGSIATNKDILDLALADGLVGWWNFDNGDASDASWNGNNGVGMNGVVFENGYAKFDGVDDYIITASVSTDYGTAVSVCAWHNYNNYADTDIKKIVYQKAGVDLIYVREGYGVISSIYAKNGAGTSSGYTGNILKGVWTHICVVDYTDSTSGNVNQKTYINGIQTGFWQKSGFTCCGQTGASNPIFIGSDADTGIATRHINGFIDEARIYNRALSANEVSALYVKGR